FIVERRLSGPVSTEVSPNRAGTRSRGGADYPDLYQWSTNQVPKQNKQIARTCNMRLSPTLELVSEQGVLRLARPVTHLVSSNERYQKQGWHQCSGPVSGSLPSWR
ncbi:hypothetical protein AVEN_65073-1, partial [Araneus ventricosus]